MFTLFAVMLGCTQQDQELVGMEVAVDGQRVSLSWQDGPVSDAFVAIADEPLPEMPGGTPIWQIVCPGASDFAPNENACIPSTVTYGDVPDDAIETLAPSAMSSDDTFWATASGFDEGRELPYFRADVVFRIEGGEAVILMDGIQ